MIDFFMSHVLNTPGLFKKYQTKDIYPVVIGGIDLMRCCHGQGSTMDIDIKFVVIPRVTGPDDTVFKLAVTMRNTFVAEVLELAKKKQGQKQPLVDLVLGEVDVKMKTQRLCIYQDDHSAAATASKQVIIDTGIASNYSVDKFDQFRNFFSPQKPIPTFIKDNIPYATCSWVLVDTVRMLITCRLLIANEYWRKKYMKYQAKFALLYNSYNKTERATKAYQYATDYLTTGTDTNTIELVDQLLIGETNEQEIEEKLLANTNVEPAYKLIMDFFMTRILGKYMVGHKKFYPVVIGGVDVNRCVQPMFKLAVKDIDIQYIVKDVKHIDDAKVAKYNLITHILEDEDLQDYLLELGKQNGFIIRLTAFSDWDPEINQKQIDMDLVVIMVNFYDIQDDVTSTSPFKSKNMVDTIILPRPFWTHKDKAIPWYVDQVTNVTFATCGFTYYDTIYMIKWYEAQGIISKKGLAKYLRYILKFLGLYMVRTTVKDIPHATLKRLYRQVMHLVKGLVLKDGLPDVHVLIAQVKEATGFNDII